MNIRLAPGIDPGDAYAASAAVWRVRTAVKVLTVAFAEPGALVEIDAIAAIPER